MAQHGAALVRHPAGEPVTCRLRHTGMFSTLRAAAAVPVLLLLGVLLATGCGVAGSSGGGSSADEARSSAARDSGTAGADAAEEPAPGTTERSTGPAAGTEARQTASAPMTRAVISTGEVSLRARSVGTARAEVLRLVASWRGTVADEQTDSDDRGRLLSSTMTVRVPSDRFGTAMEALAGIADVEHQSRRSEDVTTQVIDNEARVRAAERSIRQIEALLARARQLSDIIAIEADLARRQADLDSLKSQQAWLEDQTSLSTITVQVNRVGTEDDEEEARGFLAGLEAGWDAFLGATQALLTAIGAALPFLVLLVVLGAPIWLVVRRRLSAGSAPARSA